MNDLFPETLQKQVTFEDILKRMKHYQQHGNKNGNKFIKSIGISRNGYYYEVNWSNGDTQCFFKLEQMLPELNRVVPHLVR